jgi:hypothetical protein
MTDLGELEQKIRDRLEEAEQRRRHREHHHRQRQADREQRRKHFRTLADRLLRLHIRPRFERLAAYFPSATPLHAEEAGRNRCVYLFRPHPDFPAAGSLELAVHHDLECELLFLTYRLDLLPVPFAFSGQDRLTLPLVEPDEARAVAWVEGKMLEALDVCLRLQAGEAAEIAESGPARQAA